MKRHKEIFLRIHIFLPTGQSEGRIHFPAGPITYPGLQKQPLVHCLVQKIGS